MTMLRRNFLFVLIVGVGCVGFAGCRGEAAPSAHATRAQINSGATGPINEARHIPRNASHSRPLRNTPHESFLSTYNNPEEGISFRYPRNYYLEEGDIQERSFFLQRQEDVDSEQPGAKLLVTVLIPEDGYPNTTFEHGSLQLVVNEAESEKGCLTISDMGVTGNGSRALTIQGVTFHWTGEETEIAGSRILERKYTGYSQGSCYQFRLVLAAEESLDPDGFTKKADMIRIMKQLENVVGSSRFFTKSVPALVEISEEADRL
jgi:hypothetical protein